MSYLVTNDDGIESPGLAALIAGLPDGAAFDVVAPHDVMSECSHRVTTKVPLQVHDHDLGFAVVGTPADCTRLAIHQLAKNTRRVVSGVNDGANLGVDVYLSGTVAAAREAVIMGLPAVALSQYRLDGAAVDWKGTAEWVLRTLARLDQEELPALHLWNVNFPDPATVSGSEPEIVFCDVDPSPLPVSYEASEGSYQYRSGRYSQRARRDGMDVAVCFSGSIAVSLIRV